jgi:hypothetical protein
LHPTVLGSKSFLIVVDFHPLKDEVAHYQGVPLDIPVTEKPTHVHVKEERVPLLDRFFGEVIALID